MVILLLLALGGALCLAGAVAAVWWGSRREIYPDRMRQLKKNEKARQKNEKK